MKNPRNEFKNLGTIICLPGRYSYGDYTLIARSCYASWQDAAINIMRQQDTAVILPLYISDQVYQVTISTHPFFSAWENGQAGFIYASKKDVVEWFGAKYCTKRLIKYAKAILLKEVDAYNAYLSGGNND